MFFKKKKNLTKEIKPPVHIGIIMDGNGRWAKKRGLPRTSGHTAGANTFRKITRYASKIGVKYLTLYAFSTENWARPETEVKAIMKLFREYLEEALRDFMDENIRVRFIGDVSVFDDKLKDLIAEVEEASSVKTGMVLNLAMNYGGRAEVIHAANEAINELISETQKEGKNLTSVKLTEEMLERYLYTAGQPDPDLIIRPSGEQRLSNFLIWQSAYSEFVSLDILWPDFKTDDLDEAIQIYSKRQRRFGGI